MVKQLWNETLAWKNLLLQIISLNSLSKTNSILIQISKDMFSSFKAARIKYENHLEEEKKKMTSENAERQLLMRKLNQLRILLERKREWCLRKKLLM